MKPVRLWLFNVVTQFLPETRCFALKTVFLRWCGAHVGKNVRIVSGAAFVGNGELWIDDDVFIGAGSRVVSVAPASVKIGSHVDMAPQVMIMTGSHEVDVAGEHIAGQGAEKSVVIGDGCWLCARSMILPGVALSEKIIVAAGSVVKESCPTSGVLLAGVPAEQKKKY